MPIKYSEEKLCRSDLNVTHYKWVQKEHLSVYTVLSEVEVTFFMLLWRVDDPSLLSDSFRSVSTPSYLPLVEQTV